MQRASLIRQIVKLAVVLLAMSEQLAFGQNAAVSTGPWDQPAAALTAQIADLLGPGPAHLTIRNLSSIPTDEIPGIRHVLEKDLQARGIQASGADAANAIRVTLSEDLRERLWVAEIIEGNQTRIAMVRLDAGMPHEETSAAAVTLRKQNILTVNEPVLAALEIGETLILLEQEGEVVFVHSAGGWQMQNSFPITHKKPLTRDPRAVLVATTDGQGFRAALAGISCMGRFDTAAQSPAWAVQCHESDDPWPIAVPAGEAATTSLRAFANAGRDYFTGVVTPSLGVDLPPFYTAALIPRPDGGGLLINGIDGKVQLAESGALKRVSGTRDWGSDFAVLLSACGSGTQIIASGSGEALTDSLRAFELPALEAIPASAPLTMEGTVTALFTATDGKSVLAVVRRPAVASQPDVYEVDRVTANCN